MHIYTHLINFPKIESNARFFELVHIGYRKYLVLRYVRMEIISAT